MPHAWGIAVDLPRQEEPTAIGESDHRRLAARGDERIFTENYSVYGIRKTWRQLHREGIPIGRDRVARLMRQAGLQGVRRGKRHFTTRRDERATRPPDLLQRDFGASAPNEKWFADITYVRTWAGFCYVALVEDAFSRMIVGWSIATHLRTSLATEALEMAVWRRGVSVEGLVHHSDAGSQYVSVAYSEHLASHGIAPSVGSVGDSSDNARPSRRSACTRPS